MFDDSSDDNDDALITSHKDPNYHNLNDLRLLKVPSNKPPARELKTYMTDGFLKSGELKHLLNSNGYLCEGLYVHLIKDNFSTAFMYVNWCLQPRDITRMNGDIAIQANVWHSDEIIILSNGEKFSSLMYNSKNAFSPSKSGNPDFTHQLVAIASISKLKPTDKYYNCFINYDTNLVMVVTSYGGDDRILSALLMNAEKNKMTTVAIITKNVDNLSGHGYRVLKKLDTATTIMIRNVGTNCRIINEDYEESSLVDDTESIHNLSFSGSATGHSILELNTPSESPKKRLKMTASTPDQACKLPRINGRKNIDLVRSSKKLFLAEDKTFKKECETYLFHLIPNNEDIAEVIGADHLIDALCQSKISVEDKKNLFFSFIDKAGVDNISSYLISVCQYVQDTDEFELLYEFVNKILESNASYICSFIKKLIYLAKDDGNNGCYSSAFYYMIKALSCMDAETLKQFADDEYILLAVVIYKLKVEKLFPKPAQFFTFIAEIQYSSGSVSNFVDLIQSVYYN